MRPEKHIDPNTKVPRRTTKLILAPLIVAGILYLPAILIGQGSVALWVVLLMGMLLTAGLQYRWSVACEKYVLEETGYIPQGIVGRLVPLEQSEDFMLRAPWLFSSFAQLEFYRMAQAHMYRCLEEDVLLDVAAKQWEEAERKELGEAVSKLASFDDIIRDEQKYAIASDWRGLSRTDIITGLIRQEILSKNEFSEGDRNLYLNRWFTAGMKAEDAVRPSQ